MLALTCPGCRRALRVKDELAGKKVRCPGCPQIIAVPAAAAVGSSVQPSADPRGPRPQAATLSDAPVPPADPAAGTLSPHDHDDGTIDAPRPEQPPARPDRELIDFLAPAEAPGELGRLGGYRVLEVLGRGGMGVVFRAEDPKLRRQVALKAMLPALAVSRTARERFLREARTAAAVEHDHVVVIHQVGEDRSGPFLAMPLLHGEPLDVRLKREGRLPVAEVLRIGREAALGLAAAHKQGLVHRDIKPANLWLEEESGRVKVLDFGLARAAKEEGHLTQTGAVIGTPAYMAPEQANGETVDARSDVFSLGCVLYRMATGDAPFKGKDALSTLMAVAHRDPAAPSAVNAAVPLGLSDLILKMLCKDPAGRPASARDVAEKLSALRAEAAGVDRSEAMTKAVPERQKATRRRRPWALLAAVLLPVLMGGGVLAVIVIRVKGPDGKETEIKVPDGSTVVVEKDGKTAATVGPDDAKVAATPPAHWQPGPAEGVLPGLVARPAVLPGIKRWQVETNSPVNIRCVACSPDGKQIAYGGMGDIQIYDAASMRLVRRLGGHNGGVNVLAWSPDGKWLASGGDDKTVRLWEADGTPGLVLRGHTSAVSSLGWSPDSKQLASGGHWGDCTVRLWGVDGKAGPILKHDTPIEAISWSPDGKVLATGDMEARKIRLWNASGGSAIATLGPFATGIDALAWSPDGKFLASNGGDWEKEKVGGWIWDAANWKQKVALQKERIWINTLGWTSDGKLAAGTQDGYIEVYDAQTGKIIAQTPQDDPLGASISANGRLIADTDGRVWKYEEEGPRLTLLQVVKKRRPRVDSIAWSPDSKKLASAGRDENVIRLWGADGTPGPILKGHEKGVYCVDWSPDGRSLASGGGDGTVRLWDADGTPGLVLKGHEGIVHHVAWSPDGKHLASTGWDDKTVRLWSADGRPGPILKGHERSVRSVAWSPDGKRLASVSDDKTVRLWAADGAPGPVVTGHEGSVTSVAWRPDGKTLGSISEDGTLRLWELDGRPILKLEASSPEYCVAWRQDGKQLASGGSDGMARLWDADGTPGPVLKGHEGPITAVAWTLDGKHLVSGGWDGEIHVMTTEGKPEWTSVSLSEGRSVTFSAAGEVLHGDPNVIEEELVYLVEKNDGQIEVLRPSEFQKRIAAGK